jgi:hypothetical protein
MNDTGKVCKRIVLEVLRYHDVDVSLQQDSNDGTMIFAKGSILETRVMPEEVGKKMLHYLGRTFGVPIHHFYNPDMAMDIKNKKVS